MQRAEPRKHGLGTEPERARLAGMELCPGFAQDLQIVDRRPGRFQQRQRLGLGVVGIELRRLAGRPSASALVARQQHAERCPLVARATLSA